VQYVGSAAQNVGQAELHGIESELSWQATDDLKLTFNHTYLTAENARSGQALVRRPRNSLNAQATWQATHAWLLGAAVRAQERRYDGLPLRQQEDFVTVRVFTRYTFDARWSLSVRVENLFDADYEEVAGYPVLPLAGHFSLECRF
jgi:vitamin B12 transporter